MSQIIDARPIFHERRIIRQLEHVESLLEDGAEITLAHRQFLRSKIARGETEAIKRRADELMQRAARRAVTGFLFEATDTQNPEPAA